MNEEEGANFLFVIAKEIKRSFETPVILFTKTDYASDIYDLLCQIRQVQMKGTNDDSIVNLVFSYHLDWLKCVREVRAFKSHVRDKPRDSLISAIDFTIDCIKNRYISFNTYIHTVNHTLTVSEKAQMHTELELIEGMCNSVVSVLSDKKNCMNYQADSTEYYLRIEYELDELLNWIDRIYDNLAYELSKVIPIQVPDLLERLTNTFKSVLEKLAISNDPYSVKIASEIKIQTEDLGVIVHVNVSHELEIEKLIEKLESINARIERLKETNSAAILALQHKKLYLEERLETLQSHRQSLGILQSIETDEDVRSIINSDKELHIFNHLLPRHDRYYLVQQYMQLWKCAINGQSERKSVISILSAADIKELFVDELGRFSVDKYGRKVYEKIGDDNLYQVNEKNELVPITDDDHVYFYDDCGRYYSNEQGARIYKVDCTASEYVMHPRGFLVKHSEQVDGVYYYYDNLGRYYIDENNERRYRERSSLVEYESDGFGNLVRLDGGVSAYTESPMDELFTEESFYLKQTIGRALIACLVDVILHQPVDPIKYLADRLEHYRESNQKHQQDLHETKELMKMREKMVPEVKEANEEALPVLTSSSEAYSYDTVYQNSETKHYSQTDSTS